MGIYFVSLFLPPPPAAGWVRPCLSAWTEGDMLLFPTKDGTEQRRGEERRGGGINSQGVRAEAHLVVIGRLTRHGKWDLGRTHTLSLAFALSQQARLTFSTHNPAAAAHAMSKRRRCDANISTKISAQGALGKSPMPTSPTPTLAKPGVYLSTLMLLRRLSWSLPLCMPSQVLSSPVLGLSLVPGSPGAGAKGP